MIQLLSNGWVTGWSAKYFSEMFNKTVPDLVQLVLAHWNARLVSREMMNAVLLCQWYKGAAAFTEVICCTPPPHKWRALVWPWDWQPLMVKRWCWWCLWWEIPELLWWWGQLAGDCPRVPGMDRVDLSCCILRFWSDLLLRKQTQTDG